jgi:hypothetical protein
MPVILASKSFTDIYGNSTDYFKANAGDKITCEFGVNCEISAISSVSNQFTINKFENKLERSSGSFIADGFRVGQVVLFNIVNNVNANTNVYTGTISTVTDYVIQMSGLPNLNNWTTGSDYITLLLAADSFDSIEVGMNFVDNETSSPSLESFIDQEVSRFIADGVSAMAVTDVKNLTQVGNKSGQFTISNATIERLTDVSNPYTTITSSRLNYLISFDIIFTGLFDSALFKGVNCLKLFTKIDFKVNTGESFLPTTISILDKADTGYFDDGYNSEVPKCSTITQVSELHYNEINNIILTIPTTGTAITQLEIGGCYITIDEDFNQNKKNAQDYYLPLLKSGLVDAGDIGTTFTSSSDTYFEVDLVDFSYVDGGGNRTFTFELDFNPLYNSPTNFGKFIEGRGEQERLFAFWIKVGNVNKTFFNGQMSFNLPVGALFTPLDDAIINHDNNVDYSDLSVLPTGNEDFNLEDDLAYLIDFELMEADVNQSVTAKIVVTDGTDEFDLDSVNFDVSNDDLNYFIDKTIGINNHLPSSSSKKQAYLYLLTALSGGVAEFRLYFPFILRWEYWIKQLNALPYFKSINADTQNWVEFQDSPYSVKIKVEIQRNGVIDWYYKAITFKTYDDSTIVSNITIWDDTETLQYNVLKKNANILIKAVHTFPVPYVGFPYGTITIEPKESAPPFVLSTEINRTQSNNPLIGISEPKRVDMEFTSATEITLRCLVDTSLLTGGTYSIGSKISEDGTDNNHIEYGKITEDSIDKLTEDLTLKITD